MKNFEENLIEQFDKFKVSVPDFADHLEHLYADYIELVALFSGRSFVTDSDILDRLKDEGELRKPENQEQGTTAESNDKNEAWVKGIFQIIEERANLYNNDYPFDYVNNRIVLASNLTPKHEIYIFLLISSNLNLFNKVRSSLTSDFEVISYFALKNYLPQMGIVKQFGKQSDYSGNAIKKINDLASDLKIQVRDHEIENISERNHQERGLDLIGWIPFDDNCPNLFTILCQCACGKEWPSKHHDTKRYTHYLKFYRLKPIHAMFIPYGLIGKDGGTKFYRSDDIEEGTLMFERKRISELFVNDAEFNALESKKVVSICTSYMEDIV